MFPGGMSNSDGDLRVVEILYDKGLTAANTLLTTCLCSDELATRLMDDFAKVYANNENSGALRVFTFWGTLALKPCRDTLFCQGLRQQYNLQLGGLAGFPFAGSIGFETVSGYIRDDRFCLMVHGSHVGVTADGGSGQGGMRRRWMIVVEVPLSPYRTGRTSSGAAESTSGGTQASTDLKRNALQNIMHSLGNRLERSEHLWWDIYALFESQDNLIDCICARQEV